MAPFFYALNVSPYLAKLLRQLALAVAASFTRQ